MTQRKEIIVKNLEELKVFAGDFLSFLCEKMRQKAVQDDSTSMNTCVVGLSGDLGAGKTTFSKEIARLLGVEETVTSPTFGIQKQYVTKNKTFLEFVHIDAYRIEDVKEIGALRFVELFEKPNILIFIEWPEKIAEVLPKETIMLSFEALDENARKISY